MAHRYEDYDSEILPDGSVMLTHRLDPTTVMLERADDSAGTRLTVWEQTFDPGPLGAGHPDSPVRDCQRKMRRTPWAFDRRVAAGAKPEQADLCPYAW